MEVAARYPHGEGELMRRYAAVFSAKVRVTWIQTSVSSTERELLKAIIPEVVKL